MRVVVLGGIGNISESIVRLLLERGHLVGFGSVRGNWQMSGRSIEVGLG